MKRVFAAAFQLLLFGLLTFVTAGIAQIDQGAITGTVKDPSGSAVPGATVVLENTGTGFKTTAQTDSGGVYTFSPVKVGRYSLTVSTPGFMTAQRSGVELQVAQRLRVDFNLTVGQVNETVTVSAQDVPLLQTEEASTGQVISSRELDNTPLNGRNYVYIAQLAAGVQEGNNYYTGAKGGFVANGTRGAPQLMRTPEIVDAASNQIHGLAVYDHGARPKHNSRISRESCVRAQHEGSGNRGLQKIAPGDDHLEESTRNRATPWRGTVAAISPPLSSTSS